MLERFRIRVEFQNTMTILKESPLQHCKAKIPFIAKKQPCNAAIELEIIPMKDLWINGSHEGVLRGLKKGPLRWEVTNIKVVFTEAYYDSVTSTTAEFRNLAPYVVEKNSYSRIIVNVRTTLGERAINSPRHDSCFTTSSPKILG